MQITAVTTDAYRFPPSVPWEDATNQVDCLELVVVQLHTDVGLVGTGFSYSVDIGGLSIKSLIEDYLANLVIGMNPLHYEEIWYKLQRQARRLGLGVNLLAIAAIDIGVWDLMGKFYKQPLYKLLGAAKEKISVYISEINLSADDDLSALEKRADEYASRGYRAVKIKIGKEDIQEDIERIKLVQKRLGPRGQVFVDLNQKWSSYEAKAKAALLDQLRLGWIEEPLLYQDIRGHADLKKAIKTPIALGESLYSKHQFLEYLTADAVDIIQADVVFVGGITEWVKIAHLANAFGRLVAPHFMMELSIHLLCGVPNGYMLENVVGGSFFELGLVEAPLIIQDAVGIPPNLPGHGIVFQQAKMGKYRYDGKALRSSFYGGSK